jgi:hypothetical protein
MMKLRKCIVVAAALLLAAPQVGALEAEPTPAQVFGKFSDAEIAKRVDAAIAQVIARPEAAGLSVAVARGDKIVVSAVRALPSWR